MLLIFSCVWLPGRVGLPGDCLLQEMKSLRGKNSYRMRQQALGSWGKAGFDSGVVPLPQLSPSRCAHIAILPRKETEQKQRELFLLKTSGLCSCISSTLLSTYSHWGEFWLFPLPWDPLLLDWCIWFTKANSVLGPGFSAWVARMTLSTWLPYCPSQICNL